ncbi:Alpha/Beta hydrolase protein [Mycena capillaripes]|nr:Alpha/Beta hydrolase protein [Mycena capillaripes]
MYPAVSSLFILMLCSISGRIPYYISLSKTDAITVLARSTSLVITVLARPRWLYLLHITVPPRDAQPQPVRRSSAPSADMRFPLGILSLSTAVQTPFKFDGQTLVASSARNDNFTFAFKEAADVFSPRNLIELGRPGTGVANNAGDLVLIPYTKFSLDEKTNNKSIFIAPLQQETDSEPLEIALPDGGEAFWLDRRTLAHAVDSGKGNLDLYALNLNFESNLSKPPSAEDPVFIGSFPTKTSTKFQYSNGVLVFVDYVYADGNLTSVKEQDEMRKPNAPMVFDQLGERFWDAWLSPKSASLFSVDLVRGSDRNWTMASDFKNLLKGTGHTPGQFSFMEGHVIYTTGEPGVPESMQERLNVFLVKTVDPGNPIQLTTGRQGSAASPILNSDATKAAWIQEEKLFHVRAEIQVFDLIDKEPLIIGLNDWDRVPLEMAFSLGDDILYLTAKDQAKTKVFALPIPYIPSVSAGRPILPPNPIALTHKGVASGIQLLSNGRLLFSRSSYTSPNDIYLIHDLESFESDIQTNLATAEFKGKIEQITHLTADGLKGKDLDEGEEFWFKGARDKDVQGWIFKPKEWSKADKNKWPVAMVIHGGPASAFADAWSTSWNPNMFSQQGYFSIWMNPTGSTGFGAEFTEAVVEDWGGKPFVDMINGFKYVLESYPQIDPDRAVAAGASYGGYAVNWIQGHPEYGFKFKALVCHDGMFNTISSSYTTDVPMGLNFDFGGVPWEKKAQAIHQKFNPANFVNHWSTPQLLIHGSKDYRLPETESIAPFHALQQLGIPSRLVIFPDENHS